MEITRAKNEDIPEILRLYKDCIRAMALKGIFQWDDKYPNRETAEEDNNNGWLYVYRQNGAIAGVLTINNVQSPEYNDITWELKDKNPAVIHRLAVNPLYQRHGIARSMMAFAEALAAENCHRSIRLDTYSINHFALRLYDRLGYRRAGTIYFSYRTVPFICFEKVVKTK